jgi:hypothetical protein
MTVSRIAVLSLVSLAVEHHLSVRFDAQNENW